MMFDAVNFNPIVTNPGHLQGENPHNLYDTESLH
jgi:hypothetical protein